MTPRQCNEAQSKMMAHAAETIKMPCSVLVVEDDKDVADMLVEILSEEGIPSESAANGLEALSKLEKGLSPALIMLDLRMPIMTGWEFLETIRASRRYQELPVIILSSELDQEVRALVQASFFKPPDIDDLLSAVNKLLS